MQIQTHTDSDLETQSQKYTQRIEEFTQQEIYDATSSTWTSRHTHGLQHKGSDTL